MQEGKRVILLIGPQGSGKETQGDELVAFLNALGGGKARRISSGDAFRDQMERSTDLGLAVAPYVLGKRLVPDALTIPLIVQYIKEGVDFTWDILDGFPRTPPQYEALVIALREMGISLEFAVVLEALDRVLINRLRGRRICRKCKRGYHTEFRRPNASGKCDNCGRRLYRRPDDTLSGIKTRLFDYHGQTEQILSILQCPVLRVDASPNIILHVRENMLSQVRPLL